MYQEQQTALVKGTKRPPGGKRKKIQHALVALGVRPDDIIHTGEFWTSNSYTLEFLFQEAHQGFKAQLKHFHPDTPTGDANQCRVLVETWDYVKAQFARRSIPKTPLPTEEPSEPARAKVPIWPAWPANLPPNLTTAELARILNCTPAKAYAQAWHRGYQVRAIPRAERGGCITPKKKPPQPQCNPVSAPLQIGSLKPDLPFISG